MSHFTGLIQKKLFKQIQILLWISPFSNLLRNTNFLSIFVLLSELVTFGTKKRSFQWISPKMLQTNRKGYYRCIWLIFRTKTIFVIFVLFYWLVKKKLFKQLQIFVRICPFSKLLRKTNFLCISVLLSVIVNFWTKKRIFQ